jgi:hypothetical protein
VIERRRLALGLDVGYDERTLHKACFGPFGQTLLDSMDCHGVSGQLLRSDEGLITRHCDEKDHAPVALLPMHTTQRSKTEQF